MLTTKKSATDEPTFKFDLPQVTSHERLQNYEEILGVLEMRQMNAECFKIVVSEINISSLSTDMSKEATTRLRELTLAARGSQDVGSRNLGFAFFDVSKGNLKKPDFEVLFFLLLMLRFPPILAGTKSHLANFH